DSWQAANLREAKEVHTRQIAVDPDLVAKKTTASMACEQAWRNLRAANNWADFAPKLNEVVQLAREESKQRSTATGLPPYEALLDLFEPGLRLARVEEVFGRLRSILPEMIEAVIAKQASKKTV